MSLVSHLPRHGVTLLEFPAARALTAQLCTLYSAHCKVTHPRIRREFAALSRGWLCCARLAVSVLAVRDSGRD